MNRTTKILLGVAGGFLVLCVCATLAGVLLVRAFAERVATDPAQMALAAEGIATYVLPSGWQEQYTAEMFGYSVLAIQPGHPRGHVFLVRLAPDAVIDPAVIEQQVLDADSARRPGGQGERRSAMHVVGQQTVTIRGQAVTLIVSEGTNSDGDPYRSLTGVFQGRNGQVLLSISAPIASWDRSAIDRFVASID